MLPHKKRLFTLITILFTALLISGCLETAQTVPATIDDAALEAYGWSQVSLEEKSLEQNITESTTIVFNSTTVKYHNDRLISDLNEQALEFKEENNLPVSIEIPESLSAQIITYRLSLPSGAQLPSELVSKIVDSRMSEIQESNDIESTQESYTRTITLADDSEAVVKIFTSSSNTTDSGMKMMGFFTTFSNDESSTIVIGLVPDGAYTVDAGFINGTVFSIDGESEIDEMLKLVSTIE
ncbi:hypothetical protein FKV42_07255 [Methanolobus vulcani]|uniref:Lipoprotein n=1 Tax=Methanolobus vulcani TaxID=38026 RepID=A0A7Z8KNN7_9EURY|nr:hypothetical protein FKV42_07255 [Methanolobus vulcani]